VPNDGNCIAAELATEIDIEMYAFGPAAPQVLQAAMNGYTKIYRTEIKMNPETFDAKLFSEALAKCQNRDFGWLTIDFQEPI